MIRILICKQLNSESNIEFYGKNDEKLDLEVKDFREMKNSLTFTVEGVRVRSKK